MFGAEESYQKYARADVADLGILSMHSERVGR